MNLPDQIVLTDTGERRYPMENEPYVFLPYLSTTIDIKDAVSWASGTEDFDANHTDFAIYRLSVPDGIHLALTPEQLQTLVIWGETQLALMENIVYPEYCRIRPYVLRQGRALLALLHNLGREHNVEGLRL